LRDLVAPRRGRWWRGRSRTAACGGLPCSCRATKTIPCIRLASLRSLKGLRTWVGPMAATYGWTFGGTAITPITGAVNLEASLGGEWLELLAAIAPGLKRAAVIFNPDTAPASAYMPSFETAARSLKVVPIISPVYSDEEIEMAIIALGREPGGGLVVLPDLFTLQHRAPIILAAARNNVPAVYSQSAFARDGGLLSYGVDQVDLFRRAASYVDRILRGAKPAELPVQLPVKFEIAVNLKTARALGLSVPQSILLGADEVIE
jgi:putative tryptophan/tyrosine transport system substrate-binding protein